MTTHSHPLAIWFLAACVVIQSFGIAVLRAAGSGHYHATTLSAPAANVPADDEGGVADHHSHAMVEHHHHDADDSSVVTAETDGAGDGCGLVPKLQVIELGIVASVTAAPTATARDANWNQALPCAFASHVTAPLERPPRPRG